MNIIQKEFSLRQRQRGFHLITDEIIDNIPELRNFKTGMANIFIKHTSASLTINENADPDVRTDFETYFNLLIPENSKHFLHTSEGSDDMTSHIKSSILGCSLNIPIKNSSFNMGIWQGIYLCEHRNHGGKRNICVTLFGM